MARSSRSERGSERFVQWNECRTEDLDITNLIGSGSTIFGTNKKSRGNPKSHAPSVAAPGHVHNAHRARSTPVMDDTRFVKSSLPVPAAALKTPPPLVFKPHRLTPNTRSSSDTPRGTPSNGAVRTPAHSESEEEDENETPAPPARGEQQGIANDEEVLPMRGPFLLTLN